MNFNWPNLHFAVRPSPAVGTNGGLSRGLAALIMVFALGACTTVKDGVTNLIKGPASVEFLAPKDGATITGPVMLKFGVVGMDVKPAGEDLDNKRAGHHHVIINQAIVKEGEAVPFTDQYVHFGKGQTEAELNLPPGRYRLTLQFANGAHVSYGAPLSHTINIVVR
jgi:Domain of unknown function (DUF4399)